MKSMIKELWHGNITPQEDSRNNSPEMKQLMEYITRHHDDLLKTMTDEQKEILEKLDDCWSEYKQFIKAAFYGCCVIIKLKKIGRLPIQKLILAGIYD